MKLTKISLACAMALAAGQALAHAPSVTPDLEVFISGASAQQLTLGAIVEGMMTAGTIDVFYDTASSGKDYRAYFGTGKVGTVIAGKKVLVHNRAKGGSVWGVNPVARAEAISRMAIDGGCAAVVSAVYPAATYKCANTVNAVPDAGVSDVEPKMFVGNNVATGDSQLTDAERAKLTVASQNAVIMGIAVTNNMPLTSLSRAQLTSILTGTYQDWSQVDASLSGPITVERRVNGSGTQAGANAFFGGFPCVANGFLPLADASFTTPGGFTVVENSASGGVKSGLNADFAAGKMAVGILSTESVPAGTDNWHHVSIDGIAPTVGNATAGLYDYFVEQTIQYRNTTVNGVAAPSGLKASFLSDFIVRSGNPAVLSALKGVAALPTNYDQTAYPVGQVMKGTKLNNTCQPTILFY
ncbi:hypothetical protein SCD_n02831 [Sulfuricella denitrificans skB26]|uniref:PBP domain-containing protein n=1 Tax=Sulfuricella denitrificans (strain DSM 22764 / NBRC 105220 / skB26) TaxID=1163617 RepID=S6ABB0_SULDS|nr:substrate-binding domain-containing protein [Sulfuricella denitrificans]BAN36630.1 hypothetical protein SCD_n02831 [Sulfuricella denitrificans skB26]